MTPPFRTEMNRRGLLALAGGLAATAGLSACTGAATRPATGPAPTAAHSTPVTLSHWYHQYGEEGTRQAVERYASQYPGATVDVTWKPGDYDGAVDAGLKSSKAPDVFELANGPTIDMIRDGQVADLTDLFEGVLTDFNPALVARVTHDGRIWAVPQVVDLQLLFYRPSMFTAAGIAPPTTIDELLAAAKALTTPKVKGLFLGNDGGASHMGGPMLRSAGFDLLTLEGAFGFDGPQAAAALGVLHTLYSSGHVLRDSPDDWYAPDALAGGLTAMQFTGLWTLPRLVEELGDDIGVLPWPSMPGGQPNVTVGAYCACVLASGRDVETAKDYVKWLWIDGKDKQIDFATSFGLHVPARQSLALEAKVFERGPAAEAVGLSQRHGFAQSPMMWTPKCAKAFRDMMTRIVQNGADPAAEIARIRPVVEAETARVRA